MEQRILTSLLQPRAYPEPTTSVQLLQTHVSMIFITDSFVYKIKKPVDFGFLNFTTLDRRRFYCTEEVRLNSRLCPDLYLGVIEVRESPRGAQFDGAGKVIDYAVKMKRLPAERMLDRLIREERVSGEDVREIARVIARFHRAAARSEEIDQFGSIGAISGNWEENFQQLEEFVGITLTQRDLQTFREWLTGFLKDNESLFASRVSQGFIRECDGDIHAENICLDDKIYIFDCIEFNNRFRCCDTAADSAFLMMDFDFRHHPDFSEVFLSEYMTVSGDREVGRAAGFYKVYRAVVRGKVESLRLLDLSIPEADREAARERATLYFRLARGYIIRSKLPATLLITCGLMGSGKSTVAAALAQELGLSRISSDQVRKEIADIPKYRHEFTSFGNGIYSSQYNDATYRELLLRAENCLMSGQSVIVDATFSRKSERARFTALAGTLRLPCHIIWTSAPENVIKDRLDGRLSERLVISDGRWELFARQREEFDAPGDDEPSLIHLDSSRTLPETIDAVLETLGIV